MYFKGLSDRYDAGHFTAFHAVVTALVAVNEQNVDQLEQLSSELRDEMLKVIKTSGPVIRTTGDRAPSESQVLLAKAFLEKLRKNESTGKFMKRIILGVIAGFFAWAILWFGNEKALSAIWPDWFGAQQLAFEEALTNDGPFQPDTKFLLTHIVSGSIVSVISGFLAALIARENKRSPLILGCLLSAVGLLKAIVSWPLVPIWYHVIFTAMLFPLAMIGGKIKTAATSNSEQGTR